MKTYEEIMKAPHFAPNTVMSNDQCIVGSVVFEKWAGSCVIGIKEDGWEHVSVSPYKKNYTPSWDDMCRIKNMFWGEEEEVYQIHPKKSQYVNIAGNCLHLWKPIGHELNELVKEWRTND